MNEWTNNLLRLSTISKGAFSLSSSSFRTTLEQSIWRILMRYLKYFKNSKFFLFILFVTRLTFLKLMEIPLEGTCTFLRGCKNVVKYDETWILIKMKFFKKFHLPINKTSSEKDLFPLSENHSIFSSHLFSRKQTNGLYWHFPLLCLRAYYISPVLSSLLENRRDKKKIYIDIWPVWKS